MTIAAVCHGFAQSGNATSVVATVDTSGSSGLFVGIIDDQPTTSTLTDLGSNIWTPLTPKAMSGGVRARLYFCATPIVGSGHTFTVTSDAGNSYPTVAIQGFSGTSALSLFDVENGFATNGTSTSLQPGSVSPNVDGEVIITLVANANATTTSTIDSGFTRTDAALTVGGTAYGFAIAYLIQTARSAVNPTWSWTTLDTQASVIATFKPQIQDFSKELSVAQAMKRASWY
jgi:hypothetical protein